MPFTFRGLATLVAAAALLLTLPAQAEVVNGGYHIMPTPEYKARTGRDPQAGAASNVLYYGGSVLSNANVVSVIWGGSVASATVAGIPGFSAALVNSTYVDQMSQYDTFVKPVRRPKGTNQHILRGSFGGQFQITPINTSSSLLDADVQNEIKAQIAAGVLPVQDLNTLYMVYFPKSVTITLDNLVSCRDFGAYHFATNDTKMVPDNLFYSVEPDCNYSFDSITYIASHEFAEAVTDNIPTPGSHPRFPQAWNRSDGYEIADLCSGSGQLVTATKVYSVTQVWSNTLGSCSVGNYTSP